MKHTERCGENTLVEVFSAYEGYDRYSVVRWCEKCGAVVVDTDYDGRTSPGAIEPMRFPSLTKRVWALEDKYPEVKY